LADLTIGVAGFLLCRQGFRVFLLQTVSPPQAGTSGAEPLHRTLLLGDISNNGTSQHPDYGRNHRGASGRLWFALP